MPNIIIEWDPKTGVRACNSNCYNAKNFTCHCVCGGKNHGVGLRAANENMTKDFKRELKAKNPRNYIGFPQKGSIVYRGREDKYKICRTRHGWAAR